MTIDPISGPGGALAMVTSGLPAVSGVPNHGTQSFAAILDQGLAAVDAKVAKADAMMTAFALGDTIPVHQVTIAMEEARIAVELAVQVRERLTESYRGFMNMQL